MLLRKQWEPFVPQEDFILEQPDQIPSCDSCFKLQGEKQHH